jgi:hypothetical protein
MSKSESERDARSVIEEFLTAVRIESALFLDFERRLLEEAKLNPAILSELSQFNQALKDPQTRITMDWLFARTDLRAAITALLEKFGLQKGQVI